MEVRAERTRILATAGALGPRLNCSGNDKLGLSISLTLSASGDIALVRLIYAGKNKIRSDKLKDLPEDGLTSSFGRCNPIFNQPKPTGAEEENSTRTEL